jgi:hypothetical protein
VLLSEIDQVVAQARRTTLLVDWAARVEAAAQQLAQVARQLGRTAASPDFKAAFAWAHPFLTVMGDVIMGWMHLWRATIAAPKLEALTVQAGSGNPQELVGKSKEAAFYDGQIKTASYFIETVLPVTSGRMDAIAGGNKTVTEMNEKSFGG